MEPIFTAIPDKSYTSLMILFFITIGFIGMAFLIQANKISKLKGPYKQVGFLMCGLLAMMFSATLFLSTWNSYRIQPINLYEDHITCYQGKISYKEIIRAGIYTDQQQSFVDPNMAIGKSKMLVLERRNKQATIFSEDYYDINELVRKIQDQMDK